MEGWLAYFNTQLIDFFRLFGTHVSPEARPDNLTVMNGVHLGDGGYFDNSGVFALSEWLKEAVKDQTNKISGEDLQTMFNESGFQTTWLLVRYDVVRARVTSLDLCFRA